MDENTGRPGRDVIRALPKVSLHDHLEGGLRPSTVIELSNAAGIDSPSTDAAELQDWFVRQSTRGSLVEYLRSFAVTSAVLQTTENLTRVAREYVLDLADDGVIYGEVRWAPEGNRNLGLSLDAVVEAVTHGIDAGVDDVRAQGRRIDVRLLLCAMRDGPNAGEIARLAVRHRGGRVVGFDIAGPEDGFPPSADRDAFEYAARHQLPVTVHAGEAAGVSSIASALVDGRALRLGHGVRVAQDLIDQADGGVEIGPVARWVLDRGIALEVSPTSNLHTGVFAWRGPSMGDHPFEQLRSLGFAVTVNTDNRLMSATTLTDELAILVSTFGYGLAELERFQLTAARAAFASLEHRMELIHEITHAFAQARGAAHHDNRKREYA
jgi:adenosine deaminase